MVPFVSGLSVRVRDERVTVAPIQPADDAPSHHIHPCPAKPRFKQDHLNPREQLRARKARLLRVSRARSPLTLRSCDCWIWATTIIFKLDTDAHECIHDHQCCIRSRSIFNNTVQIGTSAIAQGAFFCQDSGTLVTLLFSCLYEQF